MHDRPCGSDPEFNPTLGMTQPLDALAENSEGSKTDHPSRQFGLRDLPLQLFDNHNFVPTAERQNQAKDNKYSSDEKTKEC